MNDLHATFADQGLIRPRSGRLLAGVCAGLGRRFGLTPWQARLLFLLAGLILHVGIVVGYLVLWILMPAEGSAAARRAGGPTAAVG